MSAEHRKPLVAFVVLALAVVGLIGVQRADAQHGQVVAAAIGAEVEVRGQLPAASNAHPRRAATRVSALGPAFVALDQGADLAGSLLRSRPPVPARVPEGRAAQPTRPARLVPRSPRASEAPAQEVTSLRAQDAANRQRTPSGSAGGGSERMSNPSARTPASSQASPRATQRAAGAASGAKRYATRTRPPRSTRPERGR